MQEISETTTEKVILTAVVEVNKTFTYTVVRWGNSDEYELLRELLVDEEGLNCQYEGGALLLEQGGEGGKLIGTATLLDVVTVIKASSDMHDGDGVILSAVADHLPQPKQPVTDENNAVTFLLLLAGCVWFLKLIEMLTGSLVPVSTLMSLAIIDYCDRQYKTLRWPEMYKISRVTIIFEIASAVCALCRVMF